MIRLSKLRHLNRRLARRPLVEMFGRCETGATAIEYGLIVSVMALAAMAAFGTGLTATYDSVSSLATRMTLDP